MDKKKIQKIVYISTLGILVIFLTIFLNNRRDNRSDIDKTISRYENVLVSRETYQNESLYVNIEVDVEEEYAIFTFSVKDRDLEDVIIIISNKSANMSYGIKDAIGSDFVVDNYDQSNGKIKGVKILFEKSEEYYIYLSFIVDGDLVEEYIKIE